LTIAEISAVLVSVAIATSADAGSGVSTTTATMVLPGVAVTTMLFVSIVRLVARSSRNNVALKAEKSMSSSTVALTTFL
jgi:hypothetical protein